jgi:hypothetical protein
VDTERAADMVDDSTAFCRKVTFCSSSKCQKVIPA